MRLPQAIYNKLLKLGVTLITKTKKDEKYDINNSASCCCAYNTERIFTARSIILKSYNNFSLINPAYLGNHGLFTAIGNIRSQWGGVPNGPKHKPFLFTARLVIM